MKKTSLPFYLLLLSSVFFLEGCAHSEPVFYGEKKEEYIRVLVLKGKDLFSIEDSENSLMIERGEDGSIRLNGERKDLPLRFGPGAEFVRVAGNPYRGVIEVRSDNEGLMVINELPLESYIAGIINSEISSKWPIEAIKAQAVIARTYAIYQKEKRQGPLFDLTATLMDQVYQGALLEDSICLQAAGETEGEVLFYDGMPALTVYHSNAGGMTEASKDVWGADYPYLKAVRSKYDDSSAGFLWELSISDASLEEMLKRAGYGIGRPESIEIVEKSATGRIKSLIIRDIPGRYLLLSGEELRKAVGYATLRSTFFTVLKRGAEFVFAGKGSGHGVGMSQWGAKGMAGGGYTYREILRHYYPGTEIIKLY